VKKGSISSEVPVAMAAARVGPKAKILRRKSNTASPLLHPPLSLLRSSGRLVFRGAEVPVAAVSVVITIGGGIGSTGAFPDASALARWEAVPESDSIGMTVASLVLIMFDLNSEMVSIVMVERVKEFVKYIYGSMV
jgi:hypothetical protein